MQLLKQSTAAYFQLGPFLDDTDGKTAETGLTIAQADVKLSKNGAAFAQKNDANSAVHDTAGWYRCQVNVTDTDTLGRLIAAVHEAGALPVWREFLVVTANVWDTLFSTDRLQVHVAEITTDIIDAAALKADAVTEIQTGLSTLTSAQVNTEVDTALTDIHLDHLLAADYDPASKPGVATALFNEIMEDDAGVSRFTENALEQGPGGGSGGDATAANQATIIAHLTDVKGTGFVADTDSLVDLVHTSAGAGAITYTYTLTDADSGDPIAQADVWVTTDEAGTNVIASDTTNDSGEVVFYLDAGTYYFWRNKSGVNFTNPDTEVVS